MCIRDSLYGWYNEDAGFAMARNDTHIWEHGHSESLCYDYGGDSWHESLEMCGWNLQSNFSADSTLMYEECCGWSKYELSNEYLFIAQPTPLNYFYDGPVNGYIDGTFNTLTGYSLSASIAGISVEELGINLDNFNETNHQTTKWPYQRHHELPRTRGHINQEVGFRLGVEGNTTI